MSNNEAARAEHDPDDLVMLDADEVDIDLSPDWNTDDDSGADDDLSPDWTTDDGSGADDDSEPEGEPTPRVRPATQAGPATQRRPRAPSPRFIAPWGTNVAAGERHRTYYPPYFPRIIRRLIGLIPYQEGLIGQNIRPVVVDLIRQTFSPTTLDEIASLLALAPTSLLQPIALAIADVVRACWDGPEDSGILLRSLIPEPFTVRLGNWMSLLRDDQFPGRMAGLFTGPSLEHLFLEHTHVIARPPNGARMLLVTDVCAEGRAPSVFSLIHDLQSYITSLPIVSAEELGADDTCHICLEKFGHPTPTDGPEHALRLPCRHVFGNECLTKLLVSDNQEGFKNSACPLCRGPIEVFDFEDTSVWTRVD